MTGFRRNVNLAIGAALGILFCAEAAAQEKDGFDQTQVITGDRTLSVENAYKISEMPEPVDKAVATPELNYELIPKRIATQIPVDTIEPATIKVREPLDKLYRGMVKGGVGTYATPYLEVYYNSLRNRDLSYGIHLKHLSSNQGIKNVGFSGFSQNYAEAWIKKILKQESLSFNPYFRRDVVHYYGFDPQDANIDKKDIRQRFNTIGFSGKLKSYYRDSTKLNHDFDLEFYHLSDLYEARELGVKIEGDLIKYRQSELYDMQTGFDFAGYSADGVNFLPYMYTGSEPEGIVSSTKENNAILYARPHLIKRGRHYEARIGLGLYGQFQNEARFHAFPDLEFSYSLFDDIFIPYAGITGDVERNSFRSLTQLNPFLITYLPIENTINRYEIYGGIRGNISDNAAFNLRISQKRADNTPLFINDITFSQENRFNVMYEDLSIFSVLGELSIHNSERLQMLIKGEFFSYSPDSEQKAWHLPAFKTSVQGRYNLYDKLIFDAQVFFIGKRYAKSLLPLEDEQPVEGVYIAELKPYVDVNLGVEYRYTERLSVFIQGNNLFGASYDIYYQFPAQRALILGGAKYTF